MVHLIVEISKYLLIIMFAIYTYECFAVFSSTAPKKQKRQFAVTVKNAVSDSFYGISCYICSNGRCLYVSLLYGAACTAGCYTELLQAVLSESLKAVSQ